MEQKKQPAQTNIRKTNWIILLLLFSAIGLFVRFLLIQLTPEVIPIQDNSWNEITPGYSTSNQVIEQLGQPENIIQTNNGVELEYKSDFPTIPNRIITDSTDRVVFIKERILYDENHLLAPYLEEYGDPDLVLNSSGYDSLISYVFLSKGLVIKAHMKDNSVQEKWYFVPTDETTFLNSWGENLTTESPGPEQLTE